MHPSEKINLIKRISVTLAREEWRFIDLVLTQFGLPTAHSWEGHSIDYVLAMVQDADNDTLLQVADHLGLLEPGVVIPAVPDIWMPDHFRLFISHLSADKERAMKMQEALKAFSISSFVAHIDIEPTREWQDEIELALRTADALAVIMTAEIASSNWVDQEIGIAIGRGLLVIPLLAGKNPYGFLGKYQGLSAMGRKVKAVSQDVLRVLFTHPLTHRRMTEVIINGFEQVDSWEGARAQMSLIEQIPRMDDTLLQRIVSAGQSNVKISESYGVPGRIERLVAKHVRN
jgi:hypothetical protein